MPMPHRDHPHLSREERFFEVLDAFLGTSAGYLDVVVPMPGQWVSPHRGAPAMPQEALS
jgi:hypothetical protein